MVHIRPVTVDEVFDSPMFAALCAEYEAESLRNPTLAGHKPHRAGYQALVDADVLVPLGAFYGLELVGFCAVLISPVLHFGGQPIASTETLFVAAAHRDGGAGLRLLDAAEQVAKDAGIYGLYVTAPSGGRLEQVLPRRGYSLSNQIFYKGFLTCH